MKRGLKPITVNTTPGEFETRLRIGPDEKERVAEVGAWGGFGEDLRNVHPAG